MIEMILGIAAILIVVILVLIFRIHSLVAIIGEVIREPPE